MTRREGERLGAEAERRLAQTGQFEIEPGLTDAELARIEREYGFEFADDHRAFLAAGFPHNARASQFGTEDECAWRWPDWRGGDPGKLRAQLDWPLEGILIAVEDSFWRASWGRRPADAGDALRTARLHLARVPKMVPVYAHRYLPAGPGSYGHPVLSIHVTDIIIYGTDLANYIDNEFGGSGWSLSPEWSPPPMVPFWSDFL